MTRLDRYIARQFLLNAVVLLVLLFSFVVAIDVLVNLQRYLRAGAERAPDGGTIRQTLLSALWVIDLWGPRLLQLFNYLSGVILVMALGFTCSQLVRRRELLAAVAGGVSLQRLAAPVVGCAAIVMLVQAVNTEVFVPAVAPLLTRSSDDTLERELKPFEVPLMKDGAGRMFHATYFRASEGVMQNLTVWERDEGGGLLRRISAPRAVWDSQAQAWILEDGVGESTEASRTGPRTAPVERVATDLDPTAVVARRFEGYGSNLSWRQIGRMLRGAPVDDTTRERFERIRWGRLSGVICNVLAIVIAAPFYFVREPRNMVGQTLKAAPIAGLALMGGAFGPAFAIPGLPPQIGALVPALVLAPIALAAASSVRT